MRVQIPVQQVARICALLPLIAGWAAAQAVSPDNTPPPKGAEVQQQADLHADLERAAEAMHKGQLASAAEALRQALIIDPHSIVALNNLGIVLSREGKPEEAIPLYEEVLKARPDNAATKRNLAIAHFKAQQYAPAWRLLEPMATQFPTDFQILDLSGLSLFALDRYAEAAA